MEFWGTICKLKDEIDVLNHIQRKKQIWLKYDILEHRGTKWSYKAYAKDLIVIIIIYNILLLLLSGLI